MPGGALLLLAPAVAAVLMVSAAAGGMLGGAAESHPVADFWRAVGRDDLTAVPGVPSEADRQQGGQPRHGLATEDPDDPPILRRAARFPPEKRLARYLERTNERNRRHAAVFTVVFVVSALVLAVLLALGQYYGSFRIFMPTGGSPAEREQWRHYGGDPVRQIFRRCGPPWRSTGSWFPVWPSSSASAVAAGASTKELDEPYVEKWLGR